MEQSAQLKLLQEIELENLRMLMEICEKNHLRYYLIGGSLLGAMRHRGFIPWDDDIDVGLPRPDYNRFVQIAKGYLPAHMDVKTMSSDPNYKCYFTRLINNKKKIYWDHGQYTAVIGVWMDVFPLDGLPENRLLRKLQVFRVKLAKALYKFTQIDYVTTNRQNRPFSERFLIRFAQITRIGRLMNADRRLQKLDQALQRYDYDSSAYAWNFSGCYGKREIVPHIQLGGSRTAQFEGMQASIPEAAEDYLTSIYGDYMKLPPEDQRKSHEVRFAEE